MNFQKIPPVKDSQFYIDLALSNSAKTNISSIKGKKGNKFERKVLISKTKIKDMVSLVSSHFSSVVRSFPSVDNIGEFYFELINAYVSVDELKSALASLSWASSKLEDLRKSYYKRLSAIDSYDQITPTYKSFIGRFCSVVNQINSNLVFLGNARKTMRSFPDVSTILPTVCISGFPNVGKSTLLAKISSAKPDIQNYAFTTKALNIGYSQKDNLKLQFIDTPGTLNRPDKTNAIELSAYLALKYCPQLVVYVFDLSYEYSREDQLKLFERVKAFGKPVIVYFSKVDILGEKIIVDFAKDEGFSDFFFDSQKILDFVFGFKFR